MSIEAMKKALEAMEYPLNTSHEGFDVDMAELLAHRAIESLRQAIANEEFSATQEPVAWISEKQLSGMHIDPRFNLVQWETTLTVSKTHDGQIPLYTKGKL